MDFAEKKEILKGLLEKKDYCYGMYLNRRSCNNTKELVKELEAANHEDGLQVVLDKMIKRPEFAHNVTKKLKQSLGILAVIKFSDKKDFDGVKNKGVREAAMEIKELVDDHCPPERTNQLLPSIPEESEKSIRVKQPRSSWLSSFFGKKTDNKISPEKEKEKGTETQKQHRRLGTSHSIMDDTASLAQSLQNRGEKLEELNEKSEELKNASSNFEKTAKQLLEQQKAKNRVFGLYGGKTRRNSKRNKSTRKSRK